MELSSINAENNAAMNNQKSIVDDLNTKIINKEKEIQELTTNMKMVK